MTKTRSELTTELADARNRIGRRKLERTNKEAWELRERRNALNHVVASNRLILIPLGERDRTETTNAARRRHTLRRNWNESEADRTSRLVTVRSVSLGRYSSRCTYEHITYTPQLRSCGQCSPRRLLVFLGDDHKILHAPRGWTFGRDYLGLYIVRRGNTHWIYRYHFESTDLLSVTTLRTAAMEHEANNKRAKRESKQRNRRDRQRIRLIEKARKIGVWVSLQDSVRSGNCAAGSKTWAGQNGLDASQRYPVERLDRFVTDARVQRAIEAAEKRAAQELAQGYCEV